MSDSLRLSHRAVAASAAFLLAGAALAAPAVADEGKKGGGDKGSSASNGRSQGSSRGGDKGDKGAKGDSGAKGDKGAKGDSGAKGSDEDPAGNNGTFKVDGLPYSDGMANEPHVTCGFRLKLFGFDEGQVGDVTIAGHAPSGSGTVASLDDVTFSTDAAGGGPNDPDAIFEFTAADLDLAGLTAHPKQGYHLKVTLSTGEPGGVKHKVFWFEPCETATPAPSPTVGGTENENDDDEGDEGGTVVTPPAVGAVGGTNEERGEGGEQVLGTSFTRPGSVTATRENGTRVLGTRFERGVGALPFTGSVAGTLLAVGGGLVVVGGGAWLVGRKMRHIA